MEAGHSRIEMRGRAAHEGETPKERNLGLSSTRSSATTMDGSPEQGLHSSSSRCLGYVMPARNRQSVPVDIGLGWVGL